MVKLVDYELDLSDATAKIDFKYECSPEEDEKIGDDGLYICVDMGDIDDPVPEIYDAISELEEEYDVDIELSETICGCIEDEVVEQLEEWDLEEQGEREDYYRAIGLW